MMLQANQTILCNVCKVKPAEQFVSATLESLTSERLVYRLVQMSLCKDCARIVDANLVSGQRMAEALAGGMA